MPELMSMPERRWKVIFCEGSRLEDALNDLEEQGYEVQSVLHTSTRPVQHRLDPDKVALIPQFTVTAKKWFAQSYKEPSA